MPASAAATLAERPLDLTPEFPVARRGVRAVPLRGLRWRVTRDQGEVLGYVDLIGADGAPRYRSSRMHPRTARLVALGEFTTAEDALDVVRLG